MMCLRRIAVAGVFGLAAHASLGQTTGPADLTRIIQDLGSPEFAVREKAQAQLANIPSNEGNALRLAAEDSKDAEVRARLQARIDEIEVDRLLHPKE